jgi:hypothetical protein
MNVGMLDLTSDRSFQAAKQQTRELGCFVAGTLVHAMEGLRPIEQIKVDDYVLSKPESGVGELSYQRVTQTYEYEDREVYLLSWHIVNSSIKWSEQELVFVVVTGAHPIWVKSFIDRDTGAVKEINSWLSVEEINNINFEFNWVENKAGVDIQVELCDGCVGEVDNLWLILQSRDLNVGVGFNDSVYWGDMHTGPRVQFNEGGPIAFKQKGGLLEEGKLYLEDAIDYDNYPERSAIRRSDGFLPMRRKVYNLEVENNHTYYVGKTGVLVHNTSGIA